MLNGYRFACFVGVSSCFVLRLRSMFDGERGENEKRYTGGITHRFYDQKFFSV
jgi:hypothetical protein